MGTEDSCFKPYLKNLSSVYFYHSCKNAVIFVLISQTVLYLEKSALGTPSFSWEVIIEECNIIVTKHIFFNFSKTYSQWTSQQWKIGMYLLRITIPFKFCFNELLQFQFLQIHDNSIHFRCISVTRLFKKPCVKKIPTRLCLPLKAIVMVWLLGWMPSLLEQTR